MRMKVGPSKYTDKSYLCSPIGATDVLDRHQAPPLGPDIVTDKQYLCDFTQEVGSDLVKLK